MNEFVSQFNVQDSVFLHEEHPLLLANFFPFSPAVNVVETFRSVKCVQDAATLMAP